MKAHTTHSVALDILWKVACQVGGVQPLAVPNPDGTFSDDVYNCFMKYLNAKIVSLFYKDMCVCWLGENIISISTEYIDTKDLSYQNVKVGDVRLILPAKKSEKYMRIMIQRPEKN